MTLGEGALHIHTNHQLTIHDNGGGGSFTYTYKPLHLQTSIGIMVKDAVLRYI